MKSAQCDKEQAIDDWKKMHQDVEELTNTIPHFRDGGYFKTLLSRAYEQDLIKIGKFIPQGYHCMAGEEAYKNKLRAHNEY
eukprot:178499-Ditylum_brightwellii.AAC.1